MSLYGKIEYWNERYQADQEPFEWYQDYNCIKHLLPFSSSSNHQQPSREDCRVLILGCGNSRLGEDLLRDGWRGSICNIDFSPVVVAQMQRKYNDAFYRELEAPYNRACRLASIAEEHGVSKKPIPRMEFICADVTEPFPFETGSFDLILCKGTLDAVLCSDGSVANAKRMMQECSRVLHDKHGAMVVVSYANSDNRVEYFENPGDEWWARVDVFKLPQMVDPDKFHYVFVSHKRVEDSTSEESGKGVDQSLGKSSSNEENDASVKQTSTGNSVSTQTTFGAKKYPATKLVKLNGGRASSLR